MFCPKHTFSHCLFCQQQPDNRQLDKQVMNHFLLITLRWLLTFSAPLSCAVSTDLSPNFPPSSPERAASGDRGGVALLGCRRRFLAILTAVLDLTVPLFLPVLVLLILLVEDSRGQQPLQDALVHPQLGSHLPLSGDGGGLSAQRADD